ncbi:AbrB family transcriptional regulator [Macrococcus equipercicus]|uniref:AbrB family transcriptional regulator n=1 Tax=Macrococcus equipercicus TaxID=69967 RepID=A0A9Q9F0P8_9STAP|nr:AbrB family transcriptional regulator [Macrococcus equipercicus]KAA1039991.1 AbrB family transcriptional regulator [Macrococcus equipercicus]UTH13077.1 AbrB family transcriptional regulator [Macrococcus equipercicus]
MFQLLLVILALSVGFLLMKVGMILPWLFGPIIAAVLCSKFSRRTIVWPKVLGDLGLFILGAQIGAAFTRQVVLDIKDDAVNIVILNMLLLAAAVLLSLLFKKIVDCTFETALLSSIPGALSQMIVMAEENKQANLLVVTLSQTSRLLFVIMIVPLVSSWQSGGVSHAAHKAPSLFMQLSPLSFILLVLSTAAVYRLMTKIHFPVPQLLAPILVLIIWNMMTEQTFSIPYMLVALAQVLFGIRIGLQMYSLSNQLSRRLFVGICIHNLLLIGATLVMVIVFTWLTAHPFNDLFLSAAPGGMAQIIVVGIETGANVAMISSYHIFRIFFILLIVTPLVQYILKKSQIDKRL